MAEIDLRRERALAVANVLRKIAPDYLPLMPPEAFRTEVLEERIDWATENLAKVLRKVPRGATVDSKPLPPGGLAEVFRGVKPGDGEIPESIRNAEPVEPVTGERCCDG